MSESKTKLLSYPSENNLSLSIFQFSSFVVVGKQSHIPKPPEEKKKEEEAKGKIHVRLLTEHLIKSVRVNQVHTKRLWKQRVPGYLPTKTVKQARS